MDKMSASEFSKEIIRTSSESKIVKSWGITIHEDVVARIRVLLTDDSFIEVYYNAETGKTSFAWIKNNKRVYGADNLGGWHLHPIDDPEEHIKSGEVGFGKFIADVERHFRGKK